jgi:pyruvate/2-oxoglutarate dehydrogenase complex dihydrolipoamide acyltransferase (E2) component
VAAREAEEAERAEAEAEEKEDASSRPRAATPAKVSAGRASRTRSSRSDSVATTFAKSFARQLGTKSGQALVRGVLGGLFRGR